MSAPFLSSMLEFYREFSQEAITRMNKARPKIEAGTYGSTDLISDSFALWIVGVEGWWNSALRPVASSLPVAFFNVPTGSAAHATTVPVRQTTAGNPVVTDLVSATGTTMNQAHHTAINFVGSPANPDRTQLNVRLRNLTDHNGGAANTPPGLYEGIVYIDQTALAHVVAVITPDARSGRTNRGGVAGRGTARVKRTGTVTHPPSRAASRSRP